MQLTVDLSIELNGMMVIYYDKDQSNIIYGLIVYLIISHIDDIYYLSMQRNDRAAELLHRGVRLIQQPNQPR
jgi:hypothetical protein